MKGEEIPEDDRKAIVSDIARAKGWTGKSAKSRKSECNVILKAYAKLGEAIKAFSKKAKRMQWHDAMKLARQLNKGATIQKAVSFAMKKNPGNTVSPEGRIAAGLKALVEAKPRKRDAVVKAAELLGITLKLKEE